MASITSPEQGAQQEWRSSLLCPSRKQKVRKDPNAPFIREKLELPEGHNKLLLHSCCAPCSGEVMEAILASGIEFTIYF